MTFRTAFVIVAAAFSFGIEASVRVEGEFKATSACEAYQSFRNQTNPGLIKLEIDKSYSVFEVNKLPNPDRVRVIITDAMPKERWVRAECGQSSNLVPVSRPSTQDCRTPDLADSYVLALSWQPGFCELKDKPECDVRDISSFQAKNFTLHGLWPNKRQCGINYKDCHGQNYNVDGFCDYPTLSLNTETRADLEVRMPSAAHGSCLQRHEWYKHGTCQTHMDVNQYYDIAMRLQDEFNSSGLAEFMSSNIGRTVASQDFFNIFDEAYGENMHKRLTIKCKGSDNNLVDVWINLPDSIESTSSLQSLIQNSSDKYKNTCGDTFRIDPIND